MENYSSLILSKEEAISNFIEILSDELSKIESEKSAIYNYHKNQGADYNRNYYVSKFFKLINENEKMNDSRIAEICEVSKEYINKHIKKKLYEKYLQEEVNSILYEYVKLIFENNKKIFYLEDEQVEVFSKYKNFIRKFWLEDLSVEKRKFNIDLDLKIVYSSDVDFNKIRQTFLSNFKNEQIYSFEELEKYFQESLVGNEYFTIEAAQEFKLTKEILNNKLLPDERENNAIVEYKYDSYIYVSDYTNYKYLDGLTKKAAVLRRIKIEFLFKELYPTGAHVPQIRGGEMYLVCEERFKDILKYLSEDVRYILLYKDVLNNPNIISYKINDTRKMYERKFYIHKDNYEYRRCDNADDVVLIQKLDSYKINND